jgi:hypothetical protein
MDLLGSLFGKEGGGSGKGTSSFSWTSLIEPVLSIGSDALSSYNDSKSRGNQVDLMKQLEEQDYQQQLADYNYGLQVQEAQQANAAAAGAAARANRQAQLEAMRKATAVKNKGIKESMKYYQPYADAAKQLLPQKTATTASGMTNLSRLMEALAGSSNLRADPTTKAYYKKGSQND